MSCAKILTIDDDPAILLALNEFLLLEGYSVIQASDLQSECQSLEKHSPDIILTDFELPDGNALELLAAMKTMNVASPCIVLTGHGTMSIISKQNLMV